MKYLRLILRTILPNIVRINIRRYIEKVLFPEATYNQDGIISHFNADFMKDPEFIYAYNKGYSTGSWAGADIHWRVMTGCALAKYCIQLEGDFIECGVNRGGLALSIMHYAFPQENKKIFYLFDTFNGLVEEQISEKEKLLGVRCDRYQDCYDDVVKTFEEFGSNVKIIRGPIPHTLCKINVEKISFLSIDLNCAEPEIAAVNHFWEKLVPGAVILFDDYGFPGRNEQKEAADMFADKFDIKVIPLATGQGLIIKP